MTQPFHWTPNRKHQVLADVEAGRITVAEAKATHGFSDEEWAGMVRRRQVHGTRGLAVTKLQSLRAPA